MWYTKSYRRHLCDMHIDDWHEEFLSKFSAEEYFRNLKRAKVQNAMLYFQSHVGLCHYPTKSGKMHQGFAGKENAMQRLARMCRQDGITVTGYYSLVYNNWAHDQYPEWRLVGPDNKSQRDSSGEIDSEFSEKSVCRYGMCCPNNLEYREFTQRQIHEIAEYFEFDGMFFDMLFWPQACYCNSCKERWRREVGGEIPEKMDWNNPLWQLHMKKRREWMGEFAQFAADEIRNIRPDISVELNVAYAGLPDATKALAEEVLAVTDYAGGDLYGGIYNQSFICKFYRNVTNNQPFEYMLSRCMPTLAKHTLTRSEDSMLSSVFLTAAHHGATLLIDAIDAAGTMNYRVYEQVGRVFEREMAYEKYFDGDMVEDIGVYYSLKSKFNAHGENYCNHNSCVNIIINMIKNHICCGVTGSYHLLDKYPILLAPGLTAADNEDNHRLIEYVRNGGQLYISGGDCGELLRTFFGGVVSKRTVHKVVYVAPNEKAEDCFDYFDEKYPLHFDGTAPIAEGIAEELVIAKLTLPYTEQNTTHFASIHSNPPGIPTEIPAVAVASYGRGRVIWSAVAIEEVAHYDFQRILLRLLNKFFDLRRTVFSNAPKDVEITAFRTEEGLDLNLVQLTEDYEARRVEPFKIFVEMESRPADVQVLPEEISVPYRYENGFVELEEEHFNLFRMYRIVR